MRRCAVKTLLTHSRRIHWVLLTFVQRLLHFCEMQNMTFMSCCTRCGSNMPSWHNGKWPPSIAETFTLVWHRCWPLSWYCLSETNKHVHLFVIACSVTAPHDVVRSIAISLSVCPLAYLKTTCSNDMQFSVHVACCRGLIFLWRHCNTLCTSAFVHDIMLSNNSDWNRKCSFLKNLTFSKTRLGHFLYIFSEILMASWKNLQRIFGRRMAVFCVKHDVIKARIRELTNKTVWVLC